LTNDNLTFSIDDNVFSFSIDDDNDDYDDDYDDDFSFSTDIINYL